MKGLSRSRRAAAVLAAALTFAMMGDTGMATGATLHASAGLEKGQTFYFIPKDTVNPYEVIADAGGKAALTQLGDKEVVSSGTGDSAADQEPSIQAAIESGAAGIVIAANDPNALCPLLKQAMAKGIAVITFDSDTNCRTFFVNQANSVTIGESEVQILGKEMGYSGQFAILSAESTATNQNTWIKYMKVELAMPQYKNMHLVKIYYGNDDPADSLSDTEAMLQAYPNLKGIISPTTVGISSAAQYICTHPQYRSKIILTGLGLPSQMKSYVNSGCVKQFELWNPKNLGFLAGYAVASLASKVITGKPGQSFTAGMLGKYTIINVPAQGGAQVVLGPPFVFTKANVNQFNF
jgi:rhamnose transport system substrate-binding protein